MALSTGSVNIYSLGTKFTSRCACSGPGVPSTSARSRDLSHCLCTYLDRSYPESLPRSGQSLIPGAEEGPGPHISSRRLHSQILASGYCLSSMLNVKMRKPSYRSRKRGEKVKELGKKQNRTKNPHTLSNSLRHRIFGQSFPCSGFNSAPLLELS